MNKLFNSSHGLMFEATDWPRDPERIIKLFRIGTCEGQWYSSNIAYHILSIVNNNPGNGHLQDVFEWFEHSCRRDFLSLMIMDFFNQRFKDYCVRERGFIPIPNTDHLIKHFN